MERDAALVDIYDRYRTSRHFAALRAQGLPLVQGSGPADAPIMIVGDAPGAVEVNCGVPFSGRSGKMLDRLMVTAGIRRQDCFLTNVVKFRTPGNRPPTTGEALRSIKFLRKEWLVVRPLLTIALGSMAQAALEVEDLPAGHGAVVPFWYDEDTGVYHKVSALYHPAFGLRNENARSWVEKEWKLLREEILEHCPDVLCHRCKGQAVRKGIPCTCTVASANNV